MMALFKGGFQASTLGAQISQHTPQDRQRLSSMSTLKVRLIFGIASSDPESYSVMFVKSALLRRALIILARYGFNTSRK